MQKSRPLGACLSLAHRTTPNITARSIRRWRESNSYATGPAEEDRELQERIQAMTNWQRTIWARAGRPTDMAAFEPVLKAAKKAWTRYRIAQRFSRVRLLPIGAGEFEEITRHFGAFAEAIASMADRPDALSLEHWQVALMANALEANET